MCCEARHEWCSQPFRSGELHGSRFRFLTLPSILHASPSQPTSKGKLFGDVKQHTPPLLLCLLLLISRRICPACWPSGHLSQALAAWTTPASALSLTRGGATQSPVRWLTAAPARWSTHRAAPTMLPPRPQHACGATWSARTAGCPRLLLVRAVNWLPGCLRTDLAGTELKTPVEPDTQPWSAPTALPLHLHFADYANVSSTGPQLTFGGPWGSALAGLEQLEELHLTGHRINSSSWPAALPSLSKLRVLHLAGPAAVGPSTLGSSLPPEWSSMGQLQSLWLLNMSHIQGECCGYYPMVATAKWPWAASGKWFTAPAHTYVLHQDVYTLLKSVITGHGVRECLGVA